MVIVLVIVKGTVLYIEWKQNPSLIATHTLWCNYSIIRYPGGSCFLCRILKRNLFLVWDPVFLQDPQKYSFFHVHNPVHNHTLTGKKMQWDDAMQCLWSLATVAHCLKSNKKQSYFQIKKVLLCLSTLAKLKQTIWLHWKILNLVPPIHSRIQYHQRHRLQAHQITPHTQLNCDEQVITKSNKEY